MTALVTGATSGVGREFAFALAARGYDLVIGGRRGESLEEVAGAIRNNHRTEVTTIVGDLADSQVRERFVRAIQERQVRFLVNNAGAGFSSDLAEASSGKALAANALLAETPLVLAHAALPEMVREGGGTIINVGSLAGRLAVPGASVYVAAKSFLERLSETLALELYRSGVVVQALLPGYVKTEFHRDIPDFRTKQRSRGFVRWADPADVVRASIAAADRAKRRLVPNTIRVPRSADVVVVPGYLNRLLLNLARFLPRRLLYRAALRRERLN